MPIKIAAFVDESEVDLRKRGGPANPELAEVVQQLIDAADSGNKRFAFVPIEDKMERKRNGESIRAQLRARGYHLVKQTGMGTVTKKFKSGRTKDEQVTGLFLRAEKIDIAPPVNGVVRRKRVRRPE